MWICQPKLERQSNGGNQHISFCTWIANALPSDRILLEIVHNNRNICSLFFVAHQTWQVVKHIHWRVSCLKWWAFHFADSFWRDVSPQMEGTIEWLSRVDIKLSTEKRQHSRTMRSIGVSYEGTGICCNFQTNVVIWNNFIPQPLTPFTSRWKKIALLVQISKCYVLKRDPWFDLYITREKRFSGLLQDTNKYFKFLLVFFEWCNLATMSSNQITWASGFLRNVRFTLWLNIPLNYAPEQSTSCL